MYKIIFILFVSILFFGGCIKKSYHDEMLKDVKTTIDKKEIEGIKNSYASSLIDENIQENKYINLLEDKTLSDVLKEMELIDGNFYFLKSSDILVPKSRIKINNIDELNQYLVAVLDKELFIKKSGSMFLVKILSTSETKRKSIDKIPFKLNGQVSVEELIKLITSYSGYEVSIGNYIENKEEFLSSIISVNSTNLLDAIKSIESAKNIYVDINYDKEQINIVRYKDMIIELNIPLLDIKSSNQTTTSETSGESKVENSSQIVLYDELEKMLKSIISTDKISTYHIDKASGLIFLKSTKSIENAVRIIVKAYESTFSREATIEFERIEIVLNKSAEYGIGTLSDSRQTNANTGVLKSIVDGGTLNFASDNANRLLSIVATANNEIGRILNYSKNMIVLKNNIPSVQSISQNTDYIEKIKTTVTEGVSTVEATVNTIKDGTSVTAMAKISRDKIFLNITPNIKKLIRITERDIGNSKIQLPEYNDQSYNISREIKLGETSIVGSIIIHDDAKDYQGILPLEGFAIGGNDSKSYVRREIVYIVTLNSVKGF